jgi:ATP-binding cassette subfamily B protein
VSRSRREHLRSRIHSRLQILRLTASLGGRTLLVASLLQAAAGAAPVAFIAATSVVVGRVPGALAHGLHSADWRGLRDALLVAAGLFVAEELVTPMQYAFADAIAWRVDDGLRDRILAASFAPVGLEALEQQASLDRLMAIVDASRGVGFTAGSACAGMFALGSRYLRWALGAALVGVAYTWWAAVAVAVSALGVRVGIRSGLGRLAAFEGSFWPQRRRRDYLRDLLTAPAAAKEVRVFGLVGWLQERFRQTALDAVRPVWRVRRRVVLRPYAVSVPAALALSALVTVSAVRDAAQGDLSLTRLLFVLQAIVVVATLGEFFYESDFQTELGMSAYDGLLDFERAAAAASAAPAAPHHDLGGRPRESIRFERVSFTYPGAARPVFERLDLEIEAGRSLAIVGLNGAGKTTLVKLLARLYEPDAGRIAIDGIDLRALPPAAWRRRMAAIFQDFVHYELSAADNVGFGAPQLLGDRARIDAVLDRVGARRFVAALPRGADTILSRTYDDGADLSGGQWQRLAIARALMAVEGGASVLVLDEPTANLDVRAEAAFYDRFLDLTAGLTTILISHRFSTVRRADRIVVLADGEVVEDGTHEELLARDGRYAAMFRLQAARFAG